MTAAQFLAVTPMVALGAAAVVIMLAISIWRSHLLAFLLTLAGLAAAGGMLPAAASSSAGQVTPLLTVDGYALFYTGIIVAATFAVAVFAFVYLREREMQREELYLLLLLAALGASVLVTSSHFASLFLGLELLSSSLFVLIAYPRGALNIEAGFKYLILASVSTAFMLFGMALIYDMVGTLSFAGMADPAVAGQLLFTAGLGMFIIGLVFKLALVPFHMWTPDIYQGAPAPVTAFVATVSKVGVFGVLLRYFSIVGISAHAHLYLLFTIVAIASMFAGNLLALLQGNVKRLLAYSSISHFGYLLVAFLAGGPLAVTAVTFYLAAYSATILGAFGVVSVMNRRGPEADSVGDYRGLFWSRPGLAGVFAAILFSLAGIPATAGFIGKFYLLDAGVGASQWLLVLSLVASSGVGIYYYLRLIVEMYLPAEEARPGAAGAGYLWVGSVVLAVLLLTVIWLGVYPAPLIDMIRNNVSLG